MTTAPTPPTRSELITAWKDFARGLAPDIYFTLTFRYPCNDPDRAIHALEHLLFRWAAREADLRDQLIEHPAHDIGPWRSPPGRHYRGPWFDRHQREAGRVRYFAVTEPFATHSDVHIHGVMRAPDAIRGWNVAIGEQIWTTAVAAGGMGMGRARIEIIRDVDDVLGYCCEDLEQGARPFYGAA